jgi:hypothetical protein
LNNAENNFTLNNTDINDVFNMFINKMDLLNKKIENLEKNNSELNNKIVKLSEQILEIKPSKIKLINNNNITINITAFRKEDLNFIDNNECIKKLIYTGFESIQKYVTLVHFNKDKPEYQNIYIYQIKRIKMK